MTNVWYEFVINMFVFSLRARDSFELLKSVDCLKKISKEMCSFKKSFHHIY